MEDIIRQFASGEADPSNIPAMIEMLHRIQREGGGTAEAMNNEFRRMHQQIRYYHGGGDEDDEDDPNSPGRVAVEYDEEGIRRPDPVRLQRLVSGNSVDFRYEVNGRFEDPSVDWMFDPPRDINFAGTLEQVSCSY